MTEPSAKVILDSVSPAGDRLTTLEVVMHRFVLAEFNTHRVFSRNSASSRAIPVKKQIARVLEDPAIPLVWPSEKPGMQGGEPLGKAETERATATWLKARDQAVRSVQMLINAYSSEPDPLKTLHKSLANRLLEPFMWHTVIVTSTEWEHFFNLRCHPAAMPEMRAAAESMRVARDHSVPKELKIDEWHMPYIREVDYAYVKGLEDLKKISAGRCARVSYLTHDGVRDPAKDIELYDNLVGNNHASPLEHVARPCPSLLLGHAAHWDVEQGHHLGNFNGWDQLRHRIIGF